MTSATRIGILGGTFDPIHLGHVETARVAREALDLERVVLVPARIPPHRHDEPVASGYHRFAMAALAIAAHGWMMLSDDELQAPGPSFTASTLERLHAAGLRASQLFFITGADAFAEIETWHRFPDVLDLAHFAVVSRPGFPVAELPRRLPGLKSRFVPALSESNAPDGQPAVFLVDAVTPDVSSTEVRRRLASGAETSGLICPAVAHHVERHRLYRTAS